MSGQFDTGQRFGAYELGKLLGRGGMGVVYQAQHVHLGRTVALKLLAPELSGNEDFRARFLREARLAAELDHPGIVTVYDAGDVNGVLFLAMRFVRGTDLAAVLDERAPLAAAETTAILEQVGAALDAAHAAGLVHRDVKPANVMIEGQRCYLTDFGLTKRASSDSQQLTAAGQFLGTVDYVAPEQIEGRVVDGRADIYALGCVLFECLTGSRPYPRDSQVAVIYAQLREPPPRPCELRPDLPAAIDRVIEKAMAKRPEGRYPSCADMVVAAREALAAPASPTVPVELRPAPPAPTPPGPQPAPVPVQAPPPSAQAPPPSAQAPPPSAQAPPPSSAALPTSPLPQSLITSPPPAQPAPPPKRGRRSPLPFVIGGLLVAAAVGIAIAVSGGGGGGSGGGGDTAPPATQAATQSATQPARGDALTVLPAGAAPVGVVIRDNALWVANESANTVTQVPRDGGQPRTIAVGDTPFDVASNDSSVWVANIGSDDVSRISLATGKRDLNVPVGSTPYNLTAENDFVYVSNSGDDTVSILDAQSGKRALPDVPVGSDPRGIATSRHGVWVANRGDGTVSEIVRGRVAVTVQTGAGAANVAFGGGAIWVSNRTAGTVSRVTGTPASMQVTSARVGSDPEQVAYGNGYLWVAVSGDDPLVKLDGQTGKPVGDPISVPGKPTGITAPEGEVWVTAHDAGTVSQVER